MKKYLEIGKIVSTQGIKGEVRVQAYSDSPEDLVDFEYMYLKNGESYTGVTIEYSRVQKNVVVMKLSGIDSVEHAQRYRNRMLYINRDDIELPENTYFVQDLIGLTVLDDNDRTICYGELIDVTETGANDVYHVKGASGEVVLIPAIAKVVKSTDIKNKTMTITPIRGMFDNDMEIIIEQ